MGVLRVLDGSDEKVYRWDPERREETESVRRSFDRYRERGFIACRMESGGGGGVPLGDFEPDAEEIFMIGFLDGG